MREKVVVINCTQGKEKDTEKESSIVWISQNVLMETQKQNDLNNKEMYHMYKGEQASELVESVVHEYHGDSRFFPSFPSVGYGVWGLP